MPFDEARFTVNAVVLLLRLTVNVAVVVPPPVPSSTLTSFIETCVALMPAVPYLKLSSEM